MSRKSGERVRLGLYRAGNLKCPICLTSFTEDEAKAGETVTLEHVPPKALGGSVLCLTCAPCNAGAGGSLDQAAATMNREMTGRGPEVRLNIYGTEHTTHLLSDGDARARLARLAASNPTAAQLQGQLGGREIRLLTEIKRGPTWDQKHGFTARIVRPLRNHVEASWLRSAYLMVFSLLGQAGYRYADGDAVRPIREQIMKPDEEIVPCSLWDLSSISARDNIIVMKRHKPFCWLAKIGAIGVLLPHAGEEKHYREVIELPDQIGLKCKGLVGWRPMKFGRRFELSLRPESEHADKDLFGREITVPVGQCERRIVVVNQQGLFSTFLPVGPKAPQLS